MALVTAALSLLLLPSAQSYMPSAMELLQFDDLQLKMYRLDPTECKTMDGIPLAIGLMRENAVHDEKDSVNAETRSLNSRSEENASGWGSSFYTISYLHPLTGSKVRKLETGTWLKTNPQLRGLQIDKDLHDSLDTRTVCLRKDMQYVMTVSPNKNNFEIGALVGRSDFLGPRDSLHITTWDGEYKSRIKRHDAKMTAKGISWYSHVDFYAPMYVAPPNPTLEPTPYPTWSRAPSPLPTTIRQASQQQICLESIPGYSTTWTLVNYCALFAKSNCGPDSVKNFSCVPAYLLDEVACGATFCQTFSLLAAGACASTGSVFSLGNSNVSLSHALNEDCLESFVEKKFNATELSYVNWRVMLAVQGVQSSELSDNSVAKTAVRAALCKFLPGVSISSVTLETVEGIDITPSPTKSPSTIRITQKSFRPTGKNKDAMSDEERAELKRNNLRWHSKKPSPPPQLSEEQKRNWTPWPTVPAPEPTRRSQLTKRPSPRPTTQPTPLPTFPRGSLLNSTGVFITLTITGSVESMGFDDEQIAYEQADKNLKNAAKSGALTVALKEAAAAYNASAVMYGVVLKNDVTLTTLGTLPPAQTPVESSPVTDTTAIIAGSTAAAVAGVGVGGAVVYRLFSASKDVVQVMPMEQLVSAMDGVALQTF